MELKVKQKAGIKQPSSDVYAQSNIISVPKKERHRSMR